MESNMWVMLIPLVVPLILGVVKNLVPKLPSWLVPILAPLLGAGLDILSHFAGTGSMGPLWGAILGSSGVGLREVLDQLKKRAAAPPA